MLLDDEIIRRFGDAPELEAQRRVAYALGHRAYVRLREGRTEDALDDGEALLARFEAETDPSARRHTAEILVQHVKTLERESRARRWWAGGRIGPIVISTVWEGGRHLGRRLRVDSAVARRNPGIDRALSRAPGLGSIIERRRRMEQAIAVSRALITRYESTEDAGLRQLVARVRILEAAALVFSGHVGQGFQAFDMLTKSGDEAVAEAFRAFAAESKSEGGFYGEFGSISSLSHRARTLGQGDPRITRIAYEESTRSGTRGSPSTRTGAIMARLLTPGTPRSRARR